MLNKVFITDYSGEHCGPWASSLIFNPTFAMLFQAQEGSRKSDTVTCTQALVFFYLYFGLVFKDI